MSTYGQKALQSSEVIKTALNNYKAMLYGGYIRDGLAGKAFNDIDLFFQGSHLMGASILFFVDELKSLGYAMFLNDTHSCYADSTLWVSKYTAIKNGIMLHLNLTQRIKPVTDTGLFPFEQGTDVDINNLYCEKDGLVKLWEEYPSTMKQVLDNIQAGVYEAETSVSQYRINKIESRGFKRKVTTVINVPLKKPEVKCRQCKKNVYPNEAQCWWCGVDSPGVTM